MGNATPIEASGRAPGPTAVHQRIERIDILRGFALFGVLLVIHQRACR